jgi:probable rRNA maturation factor
MIEPSDNEFSNRKIFIGSGVRGFGFREEEVRVLFKILDASKFKISEGELSVAFLDGKTMRTTHSKFFNDSSLADVITFEGDGAMNFAGEICVSPDCALRNHKKHGTTFSEEINLYLIHGYLHLAGLNDVSTAEVAEMRASENFCVSLLRNVNRLPKFFYEPL